jgi:hypothetical protein
MSDNNENEKKKDNSEENEEKKDNSEENEEKKDNSEENEEKKDNSEENEEKKDNSEENEENEGDEDPSQQKLKNLKKLGEDPPKIPGGDLLTVEPQVMTLALKVVNSLLDPKLTETIIENLTSSLHLSLENKKNKINYLKNDKGFKNKNNAMIINSIHNETLNHQPKQVISQDDSSQVKDDSSSDSSSESEEEKEKEKEEKEEEEEKDKKEDDKEKEKEKEKDNQIINESNVKIKGGRQPFFTEQECSFF